MSEAELMAAIAAASVLGGVIVKLTPTQKDDEWWRKLMKAIGRE